jgi:hypothetical protein
MVCLLSAAGGGGGLRMIIRSQCSVTVDQSDLSNRLEKLKAFVNPPKKTCRRMIYIYIKKEKEPQ